MIPGPSKFISPSGDLFFDLVNTVVVKRNGETDLLETPQDVFAWAVSAGLLEMDEAERLADGPGSRNKRFFEETRNFRDTLRNTALDLVKGVPAGDDALVAINRHLRTGYGYSELVNRNGKTELDFRADFDEPIQILAAVANDAARLLAEGDLSLVKQCESEKCVLLFYDSTKNHSRRWCSMEGCGNREKARAYYRRRKKG